MQTSRLRRNRRAPHPPRAPHRGPRRAPAPLVALALVALIALVALVALAAPLLHAQPPAAVVRGFVRTPAGAPVAGSNVFVLQTLEGAVTDSAGAFAFATTRARPLTLVARRVGFREVRRELASTGDTTPVLLVAEPVAAALAPVTVQAGRYTAGEERGATLGALEVVTTPGAAADVNRAIQTLPGVQGVDEGTGLFVRGGDFTETRAFVNDAALFNPVQLQTPVGTFVGTVDPFLLDGIYFSSGGFGARYGNALSAVVGLRTQGRPAARAVTATAGLAALSASVAQPLPRGVGVRAAANRVDLRPLFDVNGSTQRYAPPPTGRDVSGSAIWRYAPAGEVKAFAISQTNRLGVGIDDASFTGTYASDVESALSVLSWRHSTGRVAPAASVATARLARSEEFGAYRLRTELRSTQAFGEAEWTLSPERLTVRGGGEVERLASAIHGSIPQSAADARPGARTTVLGSRLTGDRAALFVETDWRAAERVRLVLGARTDRSSLTGGATLDPRASAAVALRPGLSLTAALGVYHQLPDPLFFDPALGTPTLKPMRATHAVLGMQAGTDGGPTARVELYEKRYRDLAQHTRDYAVVAGGVGTSRGVDVFLKGAGPLGVTGRVTYSALAARRTDPHTGRVARAPFDVTHTAAAIAERGWGRWQLAAAYRHATGRPFTPIAGATREGDGWAPTYGAPTSERYPALHRADVSASYVRRVTPALQAVGFVSLTNVFDRVNVQAYRYSADYAVRTPSRSTFNRSLYLGASLTWR